MYKAAVAASLLTLVSSTPFDPTPRQAAPAIQTVHVGLDEGATLRFDPPFINNVKQGTIVHFDFNAKNHTLTESTFDAPCTKLVKDGSIDTNFDHAVPSDTSDLHPFDYTFPDNSQRYFYCKQANGTPQSHCSKGMVFAINIDQARFDAFQKNALATLPPSTSTPPNSNGPDQIALGRVSVSHQSLFVAWVPSKTTPQQACDTHTSLESEASGYVTGSICNNKFSVGNLQDVTLQCQTTPAEPETSDVIAVVGSDGKKLENCTPVKGNSVQCNGVGQSVEQSFLCTKA